MNATEKLILAYAVKHGFRSLLERCPIGGNVFGLLARGASLGDWLDLVPVVEMCVDVEAVSGRWAALRTFRDFYPLSNKE